MGNYLANTPLDPADETAEAAVETRKVVEDRLQRLMAVNGTRPISSFHRELGKLMWDKCGMGRTAAGLTEALARIPKLREEFWKDVMVPGTGEQLNQSLEYAGRVADFFELAELMCRDALERNESCGGHFREEFQTPEGEARRDDENFSYVAAWEYRESGDPAMNPEPLTFDYVKPSQRSYK